MSREDVVAVAVRLFVVYLLFTMLRTIPALVPLMSGPEATIGIALYAAVLFSGVLVCALLWFFPLSIARRFLPVMREARSEQAIGGPLALTLGLTLIGVWLLAYALADIAYWITLIFRDRQAAQTVNVPMEWTHEHVANMVATGVQALLGLWLIIGNAGIRRLIYRYRYGES